MNEPQVVVVGGGLAGLTAALGCADAGVAVTLLEARPRLGGATWSARQHGLWIDNGQHVFLRCCNAYRGLLRRLEVEDLVTLQRRLAVPVLAPGGPTVWLHRQRLPSPLHLALSLARYAHLRPADRLRIARAARRLGRLDLADEGLDQESFGGWLATQGQSDEAVERFWDLITRPTLNLPAADASLALAAKVFQTGLLDDPGGGDIGYARVPLDRVHAEPAARALEKAGARILLRTRVTRIETRDHGVRSVCSDGHRFDADAVILAVPHDQAAALLPPLARVDAGRLLELGTSPIVDLHLVYDRPVTRLPLAAGIRTPLQWIFDRTEASGLEQGQYLAVSLSAAERYVGVSVSQLRSVFVPEIERIFPRAREAHLERFFVTCERAATFRQAPGTRRLRPAAATGVSRLFLAGAWTDTGWPATMESAVRSGLVAGRKALISMGRTQRLPHSPEEVAA